MRVVMFGLRLALDNLCVKNKDMSKNSVTTTLSNIKLKY